MPTAEQLREEVIACLRVGPHGWTDCQAKISPPAKWLISAARGQQPAMAVLDDFATKFGRDTDLCHTARQTINVLRAQLAGERDWKGSQHADIADAFPAAELVVVLDVVQPFPWKQRWTEAGGKWTEGRAIALKNDPVWARFSEFGRPHPPFDWLTALDWEDVSRSEAERLGILSVPKNPTGMGCAAFMLLLTAITATAAAVVLA